MKEKAKQKQEVHATSTIYIGLNTTHLAEDRHSSML